MLKMRLQRVGRKNSPSFRVVVTEAARGPKAGTPVELLGFYNPKTKEKNIDGERAKYWLSVGAQASGTVHNILISEKIIDGKKVNVLPKKKPIMKEVAEEVKAEAPAPVEATEAVPEAPQSEVAPVEETSEATPTA